MLPIAHIGTSISKYVRKNQNGTITANASPRKTKEVKAQVEELIAESLGGFCTNVG